MNGNQRIEVIVIEGGPCSGKSTGIPKIKAALKSQGWMVLVSREIPTALVDEHDYVLTEPDRNISNEEFQELVLGEVIRQEEQLLTRAVKSGHPKVLILCDRGRFGGMAYIERASFLEMARTVHNQLEDDLYGVYSGCVFLTSPAVDKSSVYLENMKNNPARREMDVLQAAVQNDLSLDACVGVSRMFVIDNSTDFDGKIRRATDAILHFLSNTEYERKWMLTEPLTNKEFEELALHMDILAVPLHISQAYLNLTEEDVANGVKSRRVRGKTLGGFEYGGQFFLTLKGKKTAGGGSEVEMEISRSEYQHQVEKNLDPETQMIVKERYYFVYAGRYFEFDIFENPAEQRPILEYEHLPGDNLETLELPEFLGVLVDSTDDPAASNANIARGRRV